jgi:methionyl-tRNA formyltransferase
MRVLMIAQDSPFYLRENLDYLITRVPQHSMICGCVLLSPSSSGQKETTFQGMMRTYRTLGIGFLVRYAWSFLASRLMPSRKMAPLLEKYGIAAIRTVGSLNSDKTIALLGTYTPDLIVSIQADVILEKQLVELAPKGCLSLHCALLPKYRGFIPTFRALKNDEQETSLSVSFVDEGQDSGSILVQKRVTVADRTPDEVMMHTTRVGMDAVIEAIELIHAGRHGAIENRHEEKVTSAEMARQKLPSP